MYFTYCLGYQLEMITGKQASQLSLDMTSTCDMLHSY